MPFKKVELDLNQNSNEKDTGLTSPTLLGLDREYLLNNLSKLIREIVADELTDQMEEYLTEKEVSKRLRIKVKTLQSWRQSGLKGPKYCKFGSAVRYPLSSVIAYEHQQIRQHTSQ